MDATNFITAVASAVSAAATWRLFRLQQAIERKSSHRVQLWLERDSTSLNLVTLSVLNSGTRPLFFRTLEVIQDQQYLSIKGSAYPMFSQKIIDGSFSADTINEIFVKRDDGGSINSFELRIQYHSGSFEKLKIDPTKLGPYKISGTTDD